MAWVKWRWIQLLGCMILLVRSEEFYISNVTINVRVGESIMLACSTSGNYQKGDLRVYWQREPPQGSSGQPDVVMHFYKGTFSEVNLKDSYRGRVRAFPEELSRGNFSLLLSPVQPEDSGNYHTIIMSNNDGRKRFCRIQLNVGAPFSKPQVTVEGCKESTWPSEVRCDTWGGFPEPFLHWSLGNEMIISDQVKTNSSITNGSISVTSVLQLQALEGAMVTCTVENPTLLTSENSTQAIRPCKVPTDNLYGLLVLVLILLVLAIPVCLFCFSKKKSTTAPTGGQASQTNANNTNQLLLISLRPSGSPTQGSGARSPGLLAPLAQRN